MPWWLGAMNRSIECHFGSVERAYFATSQARRGSACAAVTVVPSAPLMVFARSMRDTVVATALRLCAAQFDKYHSLHTCIDIAIFDRIFDQDGVAQSLALLLSVFLMPSSSLVSSPPSKCPSTLP